MALSVYKKGQGTAARGIAGLVALLLGVWAAHQMWFTVYGWYWPYRVFMTALIAFIFGGLPLYLILFHRQVADLLIETQQEMRKVAWSTRGEVISSSIVVLVTVVLLAMFIYITDRILLALAQLLGIY